MKYKKYPSYKDSEVEWLGEIPEHWVVNTLRRNLIEHKQGFYSTEAYNDNGVKLLRITDIKDSGNVNFDYCPKVSMSPNDKHFLLKNGDFVFARTGGAGSFGYIDDLKEDILFASYLIRFRFNSTFISTFLKYYFMSLSFTNSINSNIHGGVNKNIHAEDIKDSFIGMPLIKEQQQIANFLDKATAKIDTLIEKQTKQIELLKEKRQAVISHAVTKGINPNVTIKDSGVEWLGEIPEHWVVSKFGYIKTVLTDYTANGSFADLAKNVKYKDEECYARLVRLTDLRKNLENTNGVWIDENAYNYLKKSSLYGGEFLLANVGAYAGLFYQMPYLNKPASLAPNMFMAKFNNSKVYEHFMSYVAKSESAYSQLKLKATASSAQPKLNKDDFKSIVFTYPSLLEQQEIANYLDEKTSKIDKLIEKSNKSIELLKEKRTALISACVTGKIDVRELV